MPIKACADRLRGEIEAYGNPPQFPDEDAKEPEPEPAAAGAAPPTDPTKFKATKGKVASKKGKGATQWDILKNSGIPEEEIHQFQCGAARRAAIWRRRTLWLLCQCACCAIQQQRQRCALVA